MKRIFFVLCAAGFLAALSLGHMAIATPASKIGICHLNHGNDFVEFANGTLYFGKEIVVSENALDAHLAHGDSTDYVLITKEERDDYEQLYNIKLPNADCMFPPGEVEPPAE